MHTDRRGLLIDGRQGLKTVDREGYCAWSNPACATGCGSSPAIAPDGTIYALRYPEGDALCALNADGSTKWTAEFGITPDPRWNEYGPWTAVGDDGTVYAGSGAFIFAYTADGAPKWSYATSAWQLYAPALAPDGKLYTAFYNGPARDDYNVLAFDNDGALLWNYHAEGHGFSAPPTLDAAGTLYVGIEDLGEVRALYPDGTLKWSYDTLSDCGPVAIGADGTLYFGNSIGQIVALGPGSP